MTVFRDGYLTMIRGTTRIEPRRTDTSGTIRIPLLRLTRVHVPTYLTVTHRSVQPVCSRVFPIVLIPQGALSVGDASFLSSSKGQSLLHCLIFLNHFLMLAQVAGKCNTNNHNKQNKRYYCVTVHSVHSNTIHHFIGSDAVQRDVPKSEIPK